MKLCNLRRSVLLAFSLLSVSAFSQTPPPVIEALRDGGMVIVMRHASSPRESPGAADASAGNVNLERQLDEQGRRDAAAFGDALARLDIVVTETGSSPAFRAMETARLAGVDNIVAYEELSNEGMREAGEQKAEWLRRQTAAAPAAGNRLLITHGPNIGAAFPDVGDTGEGEALVFNPEISNTEPAGRIAISEWADF